MTAEHKFKPVSREGGKGAAGSGAEIAAGGLAAGGWQSEMRGFGAIKSISLLRAGSHLHAISC